MCGRLAPEFLKYLETNYNISTAFLPKLANLKQVNLTPNDYLPAILSDSKTGADERELSVIPAFWRFLPSVISTQADFNAFVKTYSTINARCETVRTGRLYQSAFKSNRCVVPIRGFFEWKAVAGERTKQPMWISPESPHGGIAAIYNYCPYLGELPSITLLTTEASLGEMRSIHHRMPVLLRENDFVQWITGNAEQAAELMKPVSSEELTFKAVNRLVNNPAWDGDFQELLADEGTPVEKKDQTQDSPSIQPDLFNL
ncbi:MAG: SOS response-associated peptidase [Sumerlaeia bacterium]